MVDDSVEVEEYIQSEVSRQVSNAVLGQGNFPEPPDKDSLLKFMRGVVDEKDDVKMVKTANVTKEEIGTPKAPVRSYLMIGRYAESEGYDLVAGYLRDKAGIIAASSLGKNAKLIDTLFTTRREMKNIVPPKVTEKKGMFGSTIVHEGVDT